MYWVVLRVAFPANLAFKPDKFRRVAPCDVILEKAGKGQRQLSQFPGGNSTQVWECA